MKISIVTATYNHIKTLPRLYESIDPSQICEWIICDDGSDDGTVDYMKSLDHKWIKKFYTPDRSGMRLARNINRGFLSAKGDIIFTVMGDSYLQNDTISQLIRIYQNGTAGCGLRENVDSNGVFISHDWRVTDGERGVKDVSQNKFFWSDLTGNSMICPVEYIKYLGGWDESLEGYGFDDWDFFFRLWSMGIPLLQYNDVRINHVFHGEQKENKENAKMFMNRLQQYGYDLS